MADPQGLFTFSGGIDPTMVLDAEITLTHGITPTPNTVRIPMQKQVPFAKNGDVTLTYDNQKIFLPDCTVDFVEQAIGDHLIWAVTILDRRWRWKFGSISGRYNVRVRNGTDIRPETKKTVRQLAQLCLAQMPSTGGVIGEQNAQIGALPADVFPEIDWFYTNPAEALTALCEQFGYRPIYNWPKDNVIIAEVGRGQQFDLSLPYEKDSLTYNPPEKPGAIVIVCGPSSTQYDFPLKEKGLEHDGRILPLDDLSYAPRWLGVPIITPNGSTLPGPAPDFSTGTRWDTKYWNPMWDFTFTGIKVPYLRHLALESVFRWYQAVPPKTLPGLNRLRGDGKGPDLETFPSPDDNSATWLWPLVLHSDQNDRLNYVSDPNQTAFDEYNRLIGSTPLEAWVYGNFVVPGGNIFQDDPGVPGSGINKINPKSLFSPTQQTLQQGQVEPQPPAFLQAMVRASGFYTGGFSIDEEHALVKFSEPVVQEFLLKSVPNGFTATNSDTTVPVNPGSAVVPAALWLRCRFNVRDPETRAMVCYERKRVLDAKNPMVRYVHRDDLIYMQTYRPWVSASGGTFNSLNANANNPLFWPQFDIVDNKQLIDAACDYYLDQIEQQYLDLSPRSVLFIGLVPMTLDGAIRQITWTIGDRGAHTHAGRDTEILHLVRDYKERRLFERIRGKLEEKQQPPPGAISYIF
jgi:hypothetical protein